MNAFSSRPKADYYFSKSQKKDPGIQIYCTPQVYDEINEHVAKDLEREYGGFLLGNLCEDSQGEPYILIDSSTPAQFTNANEVRLNFTNDTFLQLATERATKFQDKEVLGWYHSHPKMDIFLSSLDVWIQNGYFKEEYKVAVVIEPQKHLGGFFKKVKGEVSPHHYFGFHLTDEAGYSPKVPIWKNMIKKEMDSFSKKREDSSIGKVSRLELNTIQMLIFFMMGFIVFPLLLHLNYLQRVNILHSQLVELGRAQGEAESNQRENKLELQIELKKLELEIKKLSLQVQNVEFSLKRQAGVQSRITSSREKMTRQMRHMKRDLFRNQHTLTEHLFRLERVANVLIQEIEKTVPNKSFLLRQVVLFYNLVKTKNYLEVQLGNFRHWFKKTYFPLPQKEEK